MMWVLGAGLLGLAALVAGMIYINETVEQDTFPYKYRG